MNERINKPNLFYCLEVEDRKREMPCLWHSLNLKFNHKLISKNFFWGAKIPVVVEVENNLSKLKTQKARTFQIPNPELGSTSLSTDRFLDEGSIYHVLHQDGVAGLFKERKVLKIMARE